MFLKKQIKSILNKCEINNFVKIQEVCEAIQKERGMWRKFFQRRPFLSSMINWFVLSILFLLNDVIFTFYLNAKENSEFHLKIVFNAFGKAAVISLAGVGFTYFLLSIAYELENRKISKIVSNLYALILSMFGVTLAFFELEIWNRTIWDEVSYFMISILFVLIFVPVYMTSLLLPRFMLNSKNGFKLISKNDANKD